jgi:hypothetical protein
MLRVEFNTCLQQFELHFMIEGRKEYVKDAATCQTKGFPDAFAALKYATDLGYVCQAA